MPRLMNARSLLVIAVVATAAFQFRAFRSILEDVEPWRPGDRLPTLQAATIDGKPVALGELEGSAVVVSFWASWCAPCRAEMPELVTFVEKWNARKENKVPLVYLAVNSGEKPDDPDVRAVIADPRHKSVRFAFDPTEASSHRFKVRALPTTFVLDTKGRVLLHLEGYTEVMQYQLGRALAPYGGLGER